MKRITLFLVMTAIITTAAARERRFSHIDTREAVQTLAQCFAEHNRARDEARKVLPLSDYLTGKDSHYWTDGNAVYVSLYDPDTRTVTLDNMEVLNPDDVVKRSAMPEIKITRGKATLAGEPRTTVTVERLGASVMLVARDARGVPTRALHHITLDDINARLHEMLPLFLLSGNYATPSGNHAVFGPKMDFYEGDKYDRDPGIFNYRHDAATGTVSILYGDGRVSGGDPSSPKYGKMPGGGGAGALMGPMEWSVKPTVQGLDVTVVVDHKFVRHSPAIDGHTALTRVQGPFEGLDGKWTFASVLPLNHYLISFFPPEVRKLIRAEIYARHGDTFRDPATQAYFDAQTWYRRSGRPARLTAVERFNATLLK